jgi:hypothetical protein
VEAEKQPLLGNDCIARNNGVTVSKSSCHYGRVLLWQLEEQEVGVRGPPACEDVSPGAEERPLLEAVTKQRSEDRD